MNIFQAILLGLIQGITEFLPISSSGHLIITETLLGLHVDSLKDFDIALHGATLLAILIYFRRDLLNTKWWPWLILASVPAALVGFFLEDVIDQVFRSATSVAIMMILVGALFFIPEPKKSQKLTWWRALLMGLGQAVAIIPGVSRSGATIFTGMQLGLSREEAARFSFLLGSIAIAGAGLLKTLDTESISLPLPILAAGFIAAFASSFFAASFLMAFLKKHSFRIFGAYRIVLGILILSSIWILG
ncbi:MAG: undecaprenyl-diphosphate phosphatase [Candidatus Gracilibacteria bacterium]